LQNGVQVEKGAAGGNLNIVITSDGGQLEGTVTDSEQSQPLAGAHVRARVDPENDYNRDRSRQATTDQNGHFEFKDLPSGKYRVSAGLPPATPGAAAIKSEVVAVTLGEREHRALDLKLNIPKSE